MYESYVKRLLPDCLMRQAEWKEPQKNSRPIMAKIMMAKRTRRAI